MNYCSTLLHLRRSFKASIGFVEATCREVAGLTREKTTPRCALTQRGGDAGPGNRPSKASMLWFLGALKEIALVYVVNNQ